MSKHITHHQGSPRPDNDGLGCLYLIGILGILGLLSILLSWLTHAFYVVLYFLPVILTVLAILFIFGALTGTLFYYTTLPRIQAQLHKPERRLAKRTKQYEKAKNTFHTLDQRDQSLASARLNTIRDNGSHISCELLAINATLARERARILKRFHKKSPQQIHEKLLPLNNVETQVNTLLEKCNASFLQ